MPEIGLEGWRVTGWRSKLLKTGELSLDNFARPQGTAPVGRPPLPSL